MVWGKASSETTSKSNPLKFRRQETGDLSNVLWESNASSGRIFDDLLPLLKEDKDIEGICLLLSCVKDLPEKWQADLLNFSLEETLKNVVSKLLISDKLFGLLTCKILHTFDFVYINEHTQMIILDK